MAGDSESRGRTEAGSPRQVQGVVKTGLAVFVGDQRGVVISVFLLAFHSVAAVCRSCCDE